MNRPALLGIAKATPMLLVSEGLNLLLLFALTVLIARCISQGEFGFFCLGLTIVKVLATLSGLGFQQGLPRYITYQLGKKEYHKAWNSVVSSFVITTLAGSLLAILFFLGADFLSQLLRKPGSAETFKIMAFVIPPIALITLLVSDLRAIRDINGRVYFQYILRPFIGIVLMLPVMLYKFSYGWVLWAQNISYFVILIGLLIYAARKIPELIPYAPYSPVTKEIVSFSLPLLGAGLLYQALLGTDIVLLGYFKPAQDVGLYGSAMRIAQLLPVVSTAAAFIYLPVASQLFSQNKLKEFATTYTTITKWTFIATLPLFLLTFFAPGLILHVFFGLKYVEARYALQILSLGFLIHVLTGMNAMTCISLGKAGAILLFQSIGVVANITLDILFIPKYGIVGAAVASAFSLALANALITIYVYIHSTIHPFSKDYMRMIFFAIGISIVIFLLPIRDYLNHTILNCALLSVFFIVVSVAGVLVTKNFSKDDISVIRYIEEKLTKNTHFTDKFIRLFEDNREV